MYMELTTEDAIFLFFYIKKKHSPQFIGQRFQSS
jgi:hypothetical protein